MCCVTLKTFLLWPGEIKKSGCIFKTDEARRGIDRKEIAAELYLVAESLSQSESVSQSVLLLLLKHEFVKLRKKKLFFEKGEKEDEEEDTPGTCVRFFL